MNFLVKGCRNTAIRLGISGAFLLTCGLFTTHATAQVSGECDNCHTMHTSQDGDINTQVFVGTGAGWNGSNQLTGGTSHAPNAQLLRSNCVGCHSSTGTNTTVNLAGNLVPIVYTQGGYPTLTPNQPNSILAGGNFFHVATGDVYGHNVLGISPQESTITSGMAPGASAGCANSCHTSLADSSVADFTYSGLYGPPLSNIYGCQGCHNKVAHHRADDPSYRFLGGHGGMAMDYVDGGGSNPNTYEDPDWEWSNGASDHNFYKNQTGDYTLDSIGRFCAGCHGKFHAMGTNSGVDPFSGEDNGGDQNTEGGTGLIVRNSTPVNPWMRHPTNVNIPQDGEYAILFTPTPVAYNPLIPVAQDPFGNRDAIDTGDQVMCLSCHRAHASDKADALRFDYTNMIAHNAPPAFVDTGCFFCHRSKDT